MNTALLTDIYKITLQDKVRSVFKNLSSVTLGEVYDFYITKVNPYSRLKIEDIFSGKNTHFSDFDDENDFVAGTIIQESLPELDNPYTYTIDQGAIWRMRNGCVPVNTYLCICHNLKIKTSHDFIIKLLLQLEKEGLWVETEGASIPRVVKRVYQIWNQLNPDRKVSYFKLYQDIEATKKGYRLVCGRNTFSAYTKDKLDNRSIDKANYPGWTRKGGHCFTSMDSKKLSKTKVIEIKKGEKEKPYNYGSPGEGTVIVNSYPSTHKQHNNYLHNNFKTHQKNGIVYSWTYLIYEIDPEEVKNPEKNIFSKKSKYGNIIKDKMEKLDLKKEDLPYNNYKDDRIATIGDVKELDTLMLLNTKLKDKNK